MVMSTVGPTRRKWPPFWGVVLTSSVNVTLGSVIGRLADTATVTPIVPTTPWEEIVNEPGSLVWVMVRTPPPSESTAPVMPIWICALPAESTVRVTLMLEALRVCPSTVREALVALSATDVGVTERLNVPPRDTFGRFRETVPLTLPVSPVEANVSEPEPFVSWRKGGPRAPTFPPPSDSDSCVLARVSVRTPLGRVSVMSVVSDWPRRVRLRPSPPLDEYAPAAVPLPV